VIDVRVVGLRDKLQQLAAGPDRAPVQRRRNLQHCDLLWRGRIIPQSNLAASAQALLLGLDTDAQVIAGESKRLTVERKSAHHRGTENTEEAEA
jgi:hypothetical protein